jgi:hypothetical protein
VKTLQNQLFNDIAFLIGSQPRQLSNVWLHCVINACPLLLIDYILYSLSSDKWYVYALVQKQCASSAAENAKDSQNDRLLSKL